MCLIGFGEVGQTLAHDLHAGGVQLSAWDLQFADPNSGPVRALAQSGVRRADSAADAIAATSLIVCAVTASDCLEAALTCAPLLSQGSYFLDLNSVSPGTKGAAHEAIARGSGRYVEAAVMSPIRPDGIRSPILLGGPHAADFAAIASDLGFSRLSVLSETLGRASATKMCRSVIIKGLEALLTESLLAARRYGVEEPVLDSLDGLVSSTDWRALSSYMIGRSLQHGRRRAAEMQEVSATVREAGIDSWMSEATVLRQQWAAVRQIAHAPDAIGPLLDAVLETLDEDIGLRAVPC